MITVGCCDARGDGVRLSVGETMRTGGYGCMPGGGIVPGKFVTTNGTWGLADGERYLRGLPLELLDSYLRRPRRELGLRVLRRRVLGLLRVLVVRLLDGLSGKPTTFGPIPEIPDG
jgi:hypothetical protein